MMKRIPAGLLLLITSVAGVAQCSAGDEELRCFKEEENAANQFYSVLQQEAYAALDRRDNAFAELRTAEQLEKWAKDRREFFVKQLGGFPEKSPLNARTIRTIEADGYRIECVIFESRPNHHVTANLYLPEAAGPVPGIAVSSGHSRTAKTADYNQRFALAMVRQGMAALCYDPIGQGERSQSLNDMHAPEHEGTTTEHFLMGVGSVLTGRNTASFRVWDGIRAIDYLCSRPEIDPTRIGFTGCSGGGTLTSYIMAIDDRVTCAAPACYVTNFRRLIETIGPQDSEQNIFAQIRFGLDHPDYLLMRAPRPALISSTTQDFFAVNGSWETYRQAKLAYGVHGAPHHVDLVEFAGTHGVQPGNLAAITQWMQRWLLHVDQKVPVQEYAVRASQELTCLESGQVLTLSGEKSVYDLNADFAAHLEASRNTANAGLSDDQLRSRIREMLQLTKPEDQTPPEWIDRGRVQRDGYHIDRLVLKKADGRMIPGLTWHPPVPTDDAWLSLHDGGKTGGTESGGTLMSQVASGSAVVTVDLCGQGETTSAKVDPLLGDWKTFSLAYLLGDSLVGRRVSDAAAALDFVAFYQKDRAKPRKVHLRAEGQSCIVALHLAALYPHLVTSVTLRGMPESWTDVVRNKSPEGRLDSTIHGVLAVYDFPDLIRLAGAEKVKLE